MRGFPGPRVPKGPTLPGDSLRVDPSPAQLLPPSAQRFAADKHSGLSCFLGASQRPGEEGRILIPTSQVMKLRLRPARLSSKTRLSPCLLPLSHRKHHMSLWMGVIVPVCDWFGGRMPRTGTPFHPLHISQLSSPAPTRRRCRQGGSVARTPE